MKGLEQTSIHFGPQAVAAKSPTTPPPNLMEKYIRILSFSKIVVYQNYSWYNRKFVIENEIAGIVI